ncbi:unnamed protein product [Anisakis simplex]|uniref:Transposase n=1 Tax=Anisakis simplex TaxID=6269 RepID=A0A0M3JCM2_ANISI|nr:unnamed protein product [Anisakis simplex]
MSGLLRSLSKRFTRLTKGRSNGQARSSAYQQVNCPPFHQ